jgi:uncharacterized membrane protein
MDVMDLVRLVFRWLHILPAVILLGGVFFMRLAVWPALPQLKEDEGQRIQDAFRGKWAMWVGISAGLLLLSGIVNTVLILKEYKVDPIYHGMLLLKILLALAIIYIASMLSGRSGAADRFRQRSRMWLNVNMALAIILILVAGVMRLTDRTPKTEIDAAGDNVAVSVSARE